jgi:hypothetical protein
MWFCALPSLALFTPRALEFLTLAFLEIGSSHSGMGISTNYLPKLDAV